jgi:hypothetical protein
MVAYISCRGKGSFLSQADVMTYFPYLIYSNFRKESFKTGELWVKITEGEI